jgi:O-antigen/teichoic acid export membrane protein
MTQRDAMTDHGFKAHLPVCGAGRLEERGGQGLPQHGPEVLRLFGKNTLWLLLDRAGLKVGTMLAGVILLGYLGPANVGIYSTAIAVGCLLNALLDLGLTRYAARAVAATPGQARSILALSLTSTVVATLFELCAAAASYYTGHWYWTCLCVGFIFTNLDGTATACSGMLSADLRSRAVLPGSVLNALGVVGIIALVVRFRLSVLALLVGLTVKSLIVLMFRLWQLRNFWPSSWKYFTPHAFVRLAKSSWVFFSYSLTQIGYEKVAIISFGLVADPEHVGLFSTALLIACIFPSFTYAASDALLPVMTRLYEAGRIGDLLELRGRLMNLLLHLSVPIGIALAVFAPQVCQLLGNRFVAAAMILRITASRSLLSVLDNFLGQAGLTAVGRVSERRNAQAIGLVLCAALTIALGALWGAIGAAAATLLADLFIVSQYFRVYRRIGLRVECPALWSSLIAGCAMALACFALPGSRWFLNAAAALLVYLVVLAAIARGRLAESAGTFRQCFVPARVNTFSNGTAA